MASLKFLDSSSPSGVRNYQTTYQIFLTSVKGATPE